MNTTFVTWRSVGRQAALPEAHLVDDLGRVEVAHEAELAGRTERAANSAAGLAGDANGGAAAPPAPCRVTHQHGFDETAVVEAVQRLLGQAAVGGPHLCFDQRVDPEVFLERPAQCLRQSAQLIGVARGT